MTATHLAHALLALAAIVAAWRAWRYASRRRALLVVAPFVLAALLAFVLSHSVRTADSLLVVTEGADAAGLWKLEDFPAHSGAVVALPGAPDIAGAERVPDLATAIRRHPGTTGISVFGDGLPRRDRDAARGRPLWFTDFPIPPGVATLHAPTRVREGRGWTVRGSAQGVAGGRVELLGPGGAVLAQSALGDDGGFSVTAHPKLPGTLDATLRLLDRDGAAVERVPVPVVVEAGAPLRIALVAGAPSAELKYFRRWARDAGHTLRTRIGLSPGIAVRDAPFALDAATLGELDLVVVDERGYATLAPRERDALDEAVRGGLGLLLRVTGPVPRDVAQDWSRSGWRIEGGGNAVPAQLPDVPATATGPRRFERADVAIAADDSALLLAATDHAALARWRAVGRGRVGTWTLLDSYRLVLAGDAPRHGSLWAHAVETLARANATARPRIASGTRAGERTTICGIADGARIEPPAGAAIALLRDPQLGCAAFWPAAPGWHVLVDGDRRTPFAVRAADAGTTLARHERRAATHALAAATPASNAAAAPTPERAPWLAALLVALFAFAWWIERRA